MKKYGTGRKKVYTLAASHLDTSWLWTLETSIDEYIPNTLFRNFTLFDKYPEYNFGFEGAYRYELMEEYYPEAFERLKEYVAAGRWYPTGASYENGDVNMPSPEALFRNILYGQTYFEETFNKKSNDIFLPDCFGFGYALPSIAAHAGLKGFSTGKLAWGSAYGQPFDIGKWYGVDGSYVYANIRPSSYSRTVKTIRKDDAVYPKLKENEEFGLNLTATFYGTGDRGGAPAEASVKAVVGEIRENATNNIEVLSAVTTQLFDDLDALPENQKAKLPTWDDELLLTNHGVGSYTSRAVGTRWNKNCEMLADCAERNAVSAAYFTGAQYPAKTLDAAWKRFIAHQFHDDITGTSFMQCYLRNWNDYMLSQKQFSQEVNGAVAAIAQGMDTSFVKGSAVIVSNTLQYERNATIAATLTLADNTKYVSVFDKDKKELPAQLLENGDGSFTVTFIGTVPAFGYAVFDVRASEEPESVKTGLRVTSNTLENDLVRVMLNASGDICEIFLKSLNKNVLEKPIRLAIFDYKGSKAWPAWELTYSELSVPPREYAANAKIKIRELGPARASLEIKRTAGKSTFMQIVSLDADSPVIRVYNEVDWRSTQSLLKVEFPLAAKNRKATYDIGLGTIERSNNTPGLYEVPAQLWADITDRSGEFGVSIFSDSRAGWDKPDDGTLRLTAMHTPYYSYRWECSQHLMDLGINRFSFGVYPHAGGALGGIQKNAICFNTPLLPFEASVHKGGLGKSLSFGNISDSGVIVRAIKKAHRGEGVVVRFNEGEGKAKNGVRFTLGDGIDTAIRTNGCEKPLASGAKARVENGELVFDIKPNGVETFLITLKAAKKKAPLGTVTPLELAYCVKAITANGKRSDGGLFEGASIPREQMPEKIECNGIDFNISQGENNAVVCNGQTLYMPKNTGKLYLLGFSMNGDRDISVLVGDKTVKLHIADCFEPCGLWDLVGLGITGKIKKDTLAYCATHIHCPAGDITARQLYVFMYELEIGAGVKSITLPRDESVVFLAATAAEDAGIKTACELYDTLEKRPFDYTLTADELRRAHPAGAENVLQRVLNRRKSITVSSASISGTFQIADGFAIVRQALDKK